MPDFRARVRDSLPAAVPPPAGWIPWAGLMQDIRHGARVLRRRLGITLGLWTAYALSRLLGTVLYGVNPHDLASFAAVGIALAVVAAVAGVVPARRAARLDPWQVLR